jgi:membrane dipeptidase
MSQGTLRGFVDNWSNLGSRFGAVTFGIEGSLDLLDISDLVWLNEHGLSTVQIHHWGSTRYFDPNGCGLTSDGLDLISEMSRYGMWLDLSHLQGRLLQDVLVRYSGRRIVSHVVHRSLLNGDDRANALTSQELRDCSADLYGVPFVDDLVSTDPAHRTEDRVTTYRDIINHIIAIADVVGVDRIALGPDYFDSRLMLDDDVSVRTVSPMDRSGGLPLLWDGLSLAGLSNYDIERVFWRNAAAVFKERL